MKCLLTLGFLLFPLLMQAQVEAGGLRLDDGWPIRIDAGGRQRLMNTTTLFVLQDRDYERIDEFRTAITAAWKLTPFRIITRKTIAGYAKDPKYSFFSLERAGEETDLSNTTRLVYSLWVPREPGVGDRNRKVIAEILLHETPSLGYQLRYSGTSGKALVALQDTIYTTRLPSWGPGLLKGCLGQVGQLLDRDRSRINPGNYSRDSMLTELRRDTLYVPDYVEATLLAGRAARSASVSARSRDIGWSFFSPVRVLSQDSLDAMLLTADRPVNYLIYTQSGANKFIQIYRSDLGLIYGAGDKSGRSFNESDIERINKKIRG